MAKAKKKKPAKKPTAPAWQDSTYLKQRSYYDKLLADFKAQQTRQKAETGTYYGTQAVQEKSDFGTYTSKYAKDKKGKWVKRKKPVEVKLKEGQKVKVRSDYYKDKSGKWIKRKKPVWSVKVGKKRVLQKGQKATEGLYQQELRESRKKDTADIADDYAGRGMIHSGLYAQKRGDYEKEFGKQLGETNRQKSKKYGDMSSEYTQFLREQELQREQARLEAIRRRAAKSGNLNL